MAKAEHFRCLQKLIMYAEKQRERERERERERLIIVCVVVYNKAHSVHLCIYIHTYIHTNDL